MKIIKTTDYKTFCQMVGANLRYCRNKKSLTQKNIGERIDITHQQVQKYEQGVSCCSAFRLDQMARIYEVPVSELLNPDFIMKECNKKKPYLSAGKTPQDAGYLKPEKDIGSLEEIKTKLKKDGIDLRDTVLPESIFNNDIDDETIEMIDYEHERRILNK